MIDVKGNLSIGTYNEKPVTVISQANTQNNTQVNVQPQAAQTSPQTNESSVSLGIRLNNRSGNKINLFRVILALQKLGFFTDGTGCAATQKAVFHAFGTMLGENFDGYQKNLSEAAKAGNTAAIEQVAFEEMSAIAEISRRLRSEDVYSIVESVFMPQGAECDLYQVVGEIIDVAHTANLYTGEGIYDLTLNVNDMIIHVAANESDLEGEPLPGRRFKGRIWLQGRIEF